MDPASQRVLLTEIVNSCSTSNLTYLNSIIAPKLKRDFLHDLPLELAHHILSFIDDPQSLARVSQVSRYWHQLIETEDWVWRAQCLGNTATSTVLSSMLLANQSSLTPSGAFGQNAAKLRLSLTSRLAAAASVRASAIATTPSSSVSSSTTPSSRELGIASALSSLEGRTTPSKRSSLGKTRAEDSAHIDQDESQLLRHYIPPQLYRQTSYKAYFKRRYMIDRNWVSGDHTLISNTTPETGVVTSLQFDHHHIVVGCDNSRIQVFETTTGRLLRTLQGHQGGVWALEFVKGVGATGEKILVSGGCDREVRIWDMNSGKCRQVMSGHTGTIRCLKLHQLPSNNNKNPGGIQNNDNVRNSTQAKQQQQQSQHIAITGSRDATLRVWDIQTGRNLFVLQGHRDSVRCIDVHGDTLVSGSYDFTARVWSLTTGECLLLLEGHLQQIYSIAFNGEYIITGSLDSDCRLWSPITGACLATLQGHTQLVGQLQLSGDSLMTGGGDGFMYMWNLKSMVCQYRVHAHEQSVTSLCFDSKRIVTGGNDGAVKLWDRQTGKFIRNLAKTDAAIWRVAICEERVVMCMQKNGRTATEIMCFDSEAPVLPQDGYDELNSLAAAVMHDQQKLWQSDVIGSFDDLRI
ncbi:hypothetical protein BGZ79_005324 [Entomortierella chlamydospora]|nr:hypothetical protein BGZ79_005324 [Entomortierella chlamydospora]